MKIKVTLDEGACMPEKAHADDAGCDLRTRYEQTVFTGDSVVFDTGIHMNIPKGYMGEIVGRSGLNIKHGIVCPKGTVDAGYIGEIKVKLYNLGDKYTFKKGDKIAQLIIVPIADAEMVQVESLEDTERGDNGFGSTGR